MNTPPPAASPASAVLQCPYPGCPGQVPEGPDDELAVCPACHRVSARCPRLGRRGRCYTLNRCLARYCRQCRQELGPGWAQAQWASDVSDNPAPGAGAARGRPLLHLHPPLQHAGAAGVLCLDGYLHTGRWDHRPLGLIEAGGWLWVGGPDGRYLLVDPFHDRSGLAPLVSEELWPGAGRGRLRARASGVWLVVHSDHGVKAVNLLALDDPVRDDYRPLDLWEAGPGERLLAGPVLLRDSRNGLERVAAWLTTGPNGPVLYAAPLLVTYGRLPAPRRLVLNLGEVHLDDGSRCALIEAALTDHDGLLLAAPQGLWLLDPAPAARGKPGGTQAADGPRPLSAAPLLIGKQLLVNVHDMPGVVYVPTAGDDACGTAFVAATDELCAVTVGPQAALNHFTYPDQGGLPLDGVTVQGRQQVLCRAGRALVLCDLLGQQTRVATSDLLPWAMHATTYGRVAVFSGRDASEGRGRWFVQVLDLENENGAIDQVVWDHLPAHPVLVGRYLFAVEAFAAAGRTSLWLTRRRLA